ncbi:MAG: cysteine--tRNA ligase [Spirochaetes bacterium]|jgi:cysteinyl-tRNA synthetase|nr:cysteine--tRNA ligase [Spirochaetota bacterium]
MVKFYNTMSRKLEEFIPGGVKKDSIDEYPPVSIYSCGPTVYGLAHIGNFRTFLFNDILRRFLKFRGFTVNHSMNITDVDDKTIKGAAAEGISLKEYTTRFTDIFFEDLKKLNIEDFEHYPRATESIDSMNDIINRLNSKDLVYRDGNSLYFSISKYDKYGKLSRIDPDAIKSGTRYDTDEYHKDDIRDFALWKEVEPDEQGWDIDMGHGRPGWHIECSAMIRKIYNSTIDIHTGGVDLVFPHHENEIAQSEAAYDEPFVRYWLHAEHLLVDNSKMSKSKGNFFTLNDLLEKGYPARSVRYLLMTAHYRKQFNFTLENLENAEQPLSRIDNIVELCLRSKKTGPVRPAVKDRISSLLDEFTTSLNHDLNISGAIGHLFEAVTDFNKIYNEDSFSKEEAESVIEVFKKIDTVLGFIFFKEKKSSQLSDEEIETYISRRNSAKSEKKWDEADSIRDLLLDKGIVLEDSKDGTRWKMV